MSQLQIDRSLCKNDAICVQTCPLSVLQMGEGHKGPAVIDDRRDRCVRCGHCEAVCAAHALSWDDRAPATALSESKITAEQAEEWLKARRSIRTYKPTPVPQELIERVLQTARFAPSGHNRQPVTWTVLSGTPRVEAVAHSVIQWMREALSAGHPAAGRLGFGGLVSAWDKGEDPICRRAPHLIFAHASPAEVAAAGACTIAVTYLQLAAYGLGLGTCWAGYVMAAMSLEPKLSQTLSLPEGHQVFGVTMLGYPKYAYQAVPERNPLNVRWL